MVIGITITNARAIHYQYTSIINYNYTHALCTYVLKGSFHVASRIKDIPRIIQTKCEIRDYTRLNLQG